MMNFFVLLLCSIFFFKIIAADVESLDKKLGVNWGEDNDQVADKFYAWYEKNGQTIISEIQGDMDSAYWVAVYLSNDEYLKGRKGNSSLSLVIYTIMVEDLKSAKPETKDFVNLAGAHVLRLVLAHKMGVSELSKYDASWISQNRGSLGGMVPVMADEDHEIIKHYIPSW